MVLSDIAKPSNEPGKARCVILQDAYSQIFCHASWQVKTMLESLLTGHWCCE